MHLVHMLEFNLVSLLLLLEHVVDELREGLVRVTTLFRHGGKPVLNLGQDQFCRPISLLGLALLRQVDSVQFHVL